ncbi:hypothetical protein B296_00044187 [Ensete ventricosum]|uniref:Uncharacterized protein n=1 Tax=Ensete ventricosum TaxID=4639 RepID=A0A426X683_ENSVE|nr:hypothetical protein B296_00044187 [Ensete ventricosum]
MINLDRRGPDPWNGFAIRTRERALSVGGKGKTARNPWKRRTKEWASQGRHERFGSFDVFVRSGTKRLTPRLVTSAHRGKDNDSRFKSFHAVSSRLATRPGWVLSTASKDKNVGHT